jgi:membrane-associated phospholipid phosphatase
MKAAPDRLDLRRRLSQAILLTAIMLASLGLYLVVLYWRGRYATVSTRLDWDEWVPFWPGWVWVYLFPYLLAPLFAALMSANTVAWYVRRGLPVVFISLAVFAILPTRTERPPETIDLGKGATARLYRNMIDLDEGGGNAAPSLHVSLTCLLACALLRDFPRWWPIIVGGVGLVWLSTLFTWQHHLLDVLTGALLALFFAAPWWGRLGL